MIRRFCDRCDKEIIEKSGLLHDVKMACDALMGNVKTEHCVRTRIGNSIIGDVELCDECQLALEKFMKNEEE